MYGETTLGVFNSKKDRDLDYFEEILGPLLLRFYLLTLN